MRSVLVNPYKVKAISTTTETTIRILKKAQSPKLSPDAKGMLTYHVGFDEHQNALLVRVTANATVGFFSHEWIAVDVVIEHLTEVTGGDPIKAILLKDLYESKGANNHSFLAAVLRNEGILVADEFKPLSSLLGDVEGFRRQMLAPVDECVALDDEVAAAESARAVCKAQQMVQLQARKQATEVGHSGGL